MKLDMQRCWVCGGNANTAEHKLKASDHRLVFGRAPKTFMHSKQKINEVIQGPKSKHLKFRPSLCSLCNSERTQPFDFAWEKLISWLIDNEKTLSVKNGINLETVFGLSCGKEAECINLFFVKQLGCQSVEHHIDLPILGFAVSILFSIPHPRIFLKFFLLPKKEMPRLVSGDVSVLEKSGQPVSATWWYAVNRIGVLVTFAPEVIGINDEVYGWSPGVSNVIEFSRSSRRRIPVRNQKNLG